MLAIYLTEKPAQATSLVPHVKALRWYNLGGCWLHIAEMHGNDTHLFRDHPESKGHVLPGRNGPLKADHVADLDLSSHLKGKLKEGDSMRTALALLYELLGDDALDPDL